MMRTNAKPSVGGVKKSVHITEKHRAEAITAASKTGTDAGEAYRQVRLLSYFTSHRLRPCLLAA